jgi:hypothetical protein
MTATQTRFRDVSCCGRIELILPVKRRCDPNGIRTRFRNFAVLRNSATNMR